MVSAATTSDGSTAGSQAEGVEKVAATTAIPTPTAAEDAGEVALGAKVKKEKRARVRFGDDEILEGPAAPSAPHAAAPHREQGHDYEHDHSLAHQPRSGSGSTPRATVRHDRPDLYEF